MIPDLLMRSSQAKFPSVTTRPLDPPAVREIGLAVQHYDNTTAAVRRFVKTVLQGAVDEVSDA